MRLELGDGYVDALRTVYSGEIEDNADYVMFWWHKAAELLLEGAVARFGFITTNSISQPFNRRVLARHLGRGLRVVWAVPDHPWVDSSDGAAVRVAMTCSSIGTSERARLVTFVAEHDREEGQTLQTPAFKSGSCALSMPTSELAPMSQPLLR